jgi:uncharacterized protein YjbI with pentapeptide repeats
MIYINYSEFIYNIKQLLSKSWGKKGIKMSKDSKTHINEILDRFRTDENDGSLEINFDDNGLIKKIVIQKKEKNISDKVEKVILDKPDFRESDFSNLSISYANMEALNLDKSNFSGSVITNSNMSGSSFYGANFEGSRMSQSNMSNSRYLNTTGAMLSGSVNLFNSSPSGLYSTNTHDDGLAGWPGSYGQFKTISNPD